MRAGVSADSMADAQGAAEEAGPASKGDRTRRRLLDAAAGEVARRGVAGTSINTIAAAAGLKPGSIYFHFESKDQLIEAMFVEGLQSSLVYLDDALAAVAGAGASVRLAAAIRAHATALHELADYAVAVLGPSFPSEAAGAAAVRRRRSYVGRWRALIEDAQREGVLPPDIDPRLLRDLVLGALNAVSLAGRPADAAVTALNTLLKIPRG